MNNSVVIAYHAVQEKLRILISRGIKTKCRKTRAKRKYFSVVVWHCAQTIASFLLFQTLIRGNFYSLYGIAITRVHFADLVIQ